MPLDVQSHDSSYFLQRAFTLLEMLVVLVVLAVLAGLLIPVGIKAQKSARKAEAVSNLKQLVSAQNLYAAEHNGTYTTIWNTDHIMWKAKLLPYLYNLEPTNKEFEKLIYSRKTVFEVPEWSRGPASTIAINWSIPVRTYSGEGWDFRVNAVPRPASIILLGEMMEAGSDTMYPHDLSSIGKGAPATPGFRRDGEKRALMAFCDGHVAALDEVELQFKGKTPKTNLWRWW